MMAGDITLFICEYLLSKFCPLFLSHSLGYCNGGHSPRLQTKKGSENFKKIQNKNLLKSYSDKKKIIFIYILDIQGHYLSYSYDGILIDIGLQKILKEVIKNKEICKIKTGKFV